MAGKDESPFKMGVGSYFSASIQSISSFTKLRISGGWQFFTCFRTTNISMLSLRNFGVQFSLEPVFFEE